MKTAVAVEKAGTEALESAGVARWIPRRVEETTTVRHRQETRGRPGANTRCRRIKTIGRRICFHALDHLLPRSRRRPATDACSDGCWLLITYDRNLTAAEVLAIYCTSPTSSAGTTC